ncbi:hypothetical protein ACQ4N7_19550 [Nodosilinea sp. AN01ver1]|uniref:hypothetical protein n=1 Tax=Nodosilinea sp. AN01ver1 TaxID=3423362 RepID=UPI003D3124A9
MGSKKKSKKKAKSNQLESQNSQGDTTVLGMSVRDLGAAVATALIAEISQVAINKMSKSVAQSNPKETLQNQLTPINDSLKNVAGGLKEAIADATSPAANALDAVESAVTNGRSAVKDRADRGLENAKEKTAVTAGIAQAQVDDLVDETDKRADQTRAFVVSQIENAIAGTRNTADQTQRAAGHAVGVTQATATATQEAVADVIDDAISQVKSILAQAGSSYFQRNGRKGKGKKAKKNKKSK